MVEENIMSGTIVKCKLTYYGEKASFSNEGTERRLNISVYF